MDDPSQNATLTDDEITSTRGEAADSAPEDADTDDTDQDADADDTDQDADADDPS